MGAVLGGPAQTRTAAPTGTAPAQPFLVPLVALGLVLVGVSAVDLGLAWFPPRFGFGEWEFGTVSRTFDGLALGTIGLVVLTVAAVKGGRRRSLLALAILYSVAVLVLLGMAILYGLNAPVALARVPVEAKRVMAHAVVRTTLFIVLYVALYGWMSRFTWRQYRAEMRGAGV